MRGRAERREYRGWGRNYRRDTWDAADPINRALSAANSCLYGLCHAAIVSAGYSPALGFIHTGKQLSFVYDIADLYKADLTIPAAFRAVAESAGLPKGASGLEGRVRRVCRAIAFQERRLLARVVADIDRVLDVAGRETSPADGERITTQIWPRRAAGGIRSAGRSRAG